MTDSGNVSSRITQSDPSFTDTLNDALSALIERSALANVRPETIVQYATGNARLLPAMIRRAAMIDADLARINAYLSCEHGRMAAPTSTDTPTKTNSK